MVSIYPEDTLEKIRTRLDPLAVLKLINYRLDTVQQTPTAIKIFCPIHREMVFRTLAVDPQKRRFRCSYSLCPGSKGGDLITLYSLAEKIDYDEAVRRLIQKMNISIELPLTGDSVEQTLEAAESALLQGTYDVALAQFQRVLTAQPDHWQALVGLLEIYRARNDEDRRLDILKRLTELARRQGKTAEATAFLREILQLCPTDISARLQYAEALVAEKKLNEALDEYMRLADTFETRKEFDRALEMYRNIEKLNLDIVDVYPHIVQLMVASARTRDAVEETLGKAAQFESRGEYDRALSCYRTVLEIDESRADIREKLIETAILAGLTDARIEECLTLVEDLLRAQAIPRALHAIEQLRSAAPDNIAVLNKYAELLRQSGGETAATELQIELICRLLDQGRLDEAETQLRRFGSPGNLNVEALQRLAAAQQRVGLNSQAAEVFATLAEILTRENRIAEAVEACESAIGLKPDEAAYRRRQIDLLRRLGRSDRALDRCLALAQRALAEKQFDEAARLTALGLEIAPDDTQMIELEAQVLAVLGRRDEARSRLLQLARKHVAAQQWDPARSVVQRILASEPDHVEAALLMADIALAQGNPTVARDMLHRLATRSLAQKDFQAAKAILTKLHEISPDDPLVLVELSTVQIRLGETGPLLDTYRRLIALYMAAEAWPKALEYCAAVLDRDPDNLAVLEQMIKVCEKTDRKRMIPDLCLRLARIYEKQGNVDRVQEYYERALAGNPELLDARIGYVRFLAGLHRFEAASQQAQIAIESLASQQRYDEAVSLIETVIEGMPDNAGLRRMLMNLYRDAGREREYVMQCTQLINHHYRRNEFAEVVELYRQLLEREPDNVTFRTHLIDALMRLRRRDEAIEQYFQLAERYLRHGSYEDAETTLTELLKHSPGNTRALDMLLGLLLEANRIEPAIQCARELSDAFVAAGRNERAIEVLRRVLALDPNNREIQQWINEISREDQQQRRSVELIAARAENHWKNGQHEAAVAAQREAVRVHPDGTTQRRRLVEMLDSLGQMSASLDEMAEIAQIRIEHGRFDSAREILDLILQRDPAHYSARRLRAELFARIGDKTRALEEFMKLGPAPVTPPPAEKDKPAPRPASSLVAGETLRIVPDFTFDNFVVGENNRFAHATALAVAKAPAIHYNPLFLYSDVGMGKTHLVSAIANYIAEHQGHLRIIYTSAEEFTNQLVEAIQNNTITLFHNRFKAADVLLVDDIQFLAGKERAQDEFFHIFNALFQAKRQMVITSDRPPREIAHLEKRLVSRFGAGVIVDIQPPDLETRAAILKKELERRGNVQMDNRLITLIAEKITSNVRELKGALNQILVKSELSGAEITEALVREVVGMYGTVDRAD
ncbi:MAG: DnaA/Hda family protein [Candidatus Sumerlaeia bacterium]|nr:DnaA/Hda family protein [Candidatus Sumerlaeia bacterium]